MATISKPYTFTDGTTAEAAEVNSNFDTIVNAINGGLDEDNISGSAQLPNSVLVDIDGQKVVDHADNLATYITATTPGDTGSPSLPTHLEGELERIRYAIRRLAGFTSQPLFMDNSASASAAAGWIEPPVVGPNLLVNPGFEYDATGSLSAAAPQGWSLNGSPTATTITAAGTVNGLGGADKRTIRVQASTTAGIEQTVSGLKASTKYLVGVAYYITGGSANLVTSGAVSGADYEDLALTDSTAAGYRFLNGIIKTDTSGSDVTITLQNSGGSSSVYYERAWFCELNDDTGVGEQVSVPVKVATHNTADTPLPATFTLNNWNWEEIGELTLDQYVPGPGYRLVYEVTASVSAVDETDDSHRWGFRIQEDVNGGGDSTVEGPYITNRSSASSNMSVAEVVNLKFVRDNPTPGSTYSYSFDIGAYNGGGAFGQMTLNPLLNTEQSVSRARLTLERI